MKRNELRLLHAAEECMEVAHRISKALRFGELQTQTDHDDNNRERIQKEFNDLCAVMHMIGFTPDQSTYHAKWDKMSRYEEKSKALGILVD